MATKPIAAWDRVGDRFYRKLPLYTNVFDPDLELDNHLISSAPYSGALALHRDASKIYQYRPADPRTSTVDIHTCAGKLIKRLNVRESRPLTRPCPTDLLTMLQWDGRPIRGLGWSEDETLVVVSRDGSVRLYENLSDDYTPFSLGSVGPTTPSPVSAFLTLYKGCRRAWRDKLQILALWPRCFTGQQPTDLCLPLQRATSQTARYHTL